MPGIKCKPGTIVESYKRAMAKLKRSETKTIHWTGPDGRVYEVKYYWQGDYYPATLEQPAEEPEIEIENFTLADSDEQIEDIPECLYQWLYLYDK